MTIIDLNQDKRDAEDACRELDGTRICGNRVKVGKNDFSTKDAIGFVERYKKIC